MLGKITGLASALLIGHLWSATAVAQWEPPSEFSREEIVKTSEQILSRPDSPLNIEEDIVRISVLRMDWDFA